MTNRVTPKIALLGWGSLIWDERPDFDKHHKPWEPDGPILPLEFSRISKSRKGALTLVIDPDNGRDCTVQYAISTRQDPEDAICDLRRREQTVKHMIGFWHSDGSRSGQPEIPKTIPNWAREKGFDVVVWTGLPSNFERERHTEFSVDAAIDYLSGLAQEGKVAAKCYISRALDFVQTPLRSALSSRKFFP